MMQSVIIGHCARKVNTCATEGSSSFGVYVGGCVLHSARVNVAYSVYIGTCAGAGVSAPTDGSGGSSADNVVAGYQAGEHNLGNYNVFIGYKANCRTGYTQLEDGERNVIIGTCANSVCTSMYKICCSVIIGNQTYAGVCGACNVIILGHCIQGNAAHNRAYYGGKSGFISNFYLCGCIVKSSGSFAIPHPSPKKYGKWLKHSFVEAPTAGDNLYRWAINTDNCKHSIELPDYYRYLNHNSIVKISSVGHFGKAYGKVSEDGNYLNICSNQDGKYNVLAIATRCDELITKGINGKTFQLEEDMKDRDIEEFGVK